MSSKPNKKIFKSALVMGAATLISRVLGLIRELLIAMYFGASGMTDAFWVAFRVPNMLRDLFAEGNFNSAFLPVLTEESQKSTRKGLQVFWSSVLLLLVLTSFISILIFIFSQEIVEVLAPSFKERPEVFKVTVNSIKILSFFLPAVSLAALSMSYLNVKKVFFVPSLAPASLNVMMIFSILVISGVLIRLGEEPVYALAIGGMSGGLLQLLVQVPFLIKNGILEKISFVLFSPAVKKIFYRMSVGIIGVAATQINLLINTFLATGTGFGSVSYLTYSLRLFQFPVGIFGVSLSNSNLVFFSEAVKAGNIEEAKDSLKGSLELSMLIIIPVTCLLYILSEDLIYLVFERGAFSTNDRLMTSMAFKAYLLGLPFYCLFKLFGPTFYALDKEKIPVGISLFSILVNIVFCLSLVDEYGFVILALGASLSIIVNSLLQIFFLKKELDLSLGFFISKKLIFFVFGSALALWILILAKSYFFLAKNWSFGEKLIQVISLSSVFLICYSLALVIFGEKKILVRFISKIKRN